MALYRHEEIWCLKPTREVRMVIPVATWGRWDWEDLPMDPGSCRQEEDLQPTTSMPPFIPSLLHCCEDQARWCTSGVSRITNIIKMKDYEWPFYVTRHKNIQALKKIVSKFNEDHLHLKRYFYSKILRCILQVSSEFLLTVGTRLFGRGSAFSVFWQ